MNVFASINSAGLSEGMKPGGRYVIQSDPQRPVFSPAIRFAPEELTLSQAITLAVYWVTIIAIALVMGCSGFSYVRYVWPERPGQHSVK